MFLPRVGLGATIEVFRAALRVITRDAFPARAALGEYETFSPRAHGWRLHHRPIESPIVPIPVGDELATITLWQASSRRAST